MTGAHCLWFGNFIIIGKLAATELCYLADWFVNSICMCVCVTRTGISMCPKKCEMFKEVCCTDKWVSLCAPNSVRCLKRFVELTDVYPCVPQTVWDVQEVCCTDKQVSVCDPNSVSCLNRFVELASSVRCLKMFVVLASSVRCLKRFVVLQTVWDV